MADQKDIRGTTPAYTFTFRQTDGTVIDPGDIDQIDILLYNVKSSKLIARYTTESPLPVGALEITMDSEEASITIPESITLLAESGDNRLELWTEKDGVKDCATCIFNEFIDAKDVS
jgi:hypothetical protein